MNGARQAEVTINGIGERAGNTSLEEVVMALHTRQNILPATTSINTEFIQVVSPDYVKMRVWERGAGITLACGTGACASLVAGVLTGKCDRKATVELPGGPLLIEWSEIDQRIYMTGPAEKVFTGKL